MLPTRMVERIFARMLVRYSAQWIRMWDGVPMDKAHQDWAEVLAPLASNPSAILYGLENLPLDFPPNAAQFKAICNRRPDAPVKQLEAPPPNPGKVAQAMQRLAEVKAAHGTPQSCLQQLLDRRAAGEVLSAAQRDYIARAQEAGIRPKGEPVGDFIPIPPEVLPPGMRDELRD